MLILSIIKKLCGCKKSKNNLCEDYNFTYIKLIMG